MRRTSCIIVALGLVLFGASPARALRDGLNGFSGPVLDVRAFGAMCDGTTDDLAALNKAYSETSATGGTIMIPAGKTCMTSADITVRSNVDLLCEPGGTIKATSGASFTWAMLSSFLTSPLQSSTSNNAIDGCRLDLNGKAAQAVFLTGDNFVFSRNVVTGGATSNGSNWTMARVNATNGDSVVRNNTISCAATSGAKDVGLQVAGATTLGNRVTGCDIYSVYVSGPNSTVETSVVTVAGSSGYGIYATSPTLITGNTLTASGASSKAIYVTSGSDGTQITNNKITHSGATGEAIRTEAVATLIQGNRWSLTSNGGGTDTTAGVYSTADYTRVIANVGQVTTPDDQTHLWMGGPQSTAIGNNLVSGAYCARTIDGNINVNFSGNRCYAQSKVQVVAATGWIINGNYLAWLGSGGRAAILAGDDISTKKCTVDHLNVTGNILSSIQAGTSGIETAAISKLCDGGSRVNETCTTDDQHASTGCPGTVGSGHCDAQTFEGVQILGNHFLYATGADPAIDLSTGVSSTSGDTWNWVITGNTFDLNTSNGVAMNFPSSNQTKVRNIQIGVNSFVGSLRLQNWTPNMGYDAQTQRLIFPVGGCDLTSTATLLPASGWGLPSTTAAAKACRPASGNYRYGVFQFAQAADKEALLTIPLTGNSNQSYNPVFLRLRFSYVTSSSNTVQWVVRGHCVTPSEDPDLAFSAENGTEAVGENIAGISNADATMITSYLKLPLPDGCFGGDLLQILVSRDGNDTTGTDNYASDVNLFDAEVTVSINNMSN